MDPAGIVGQIVKWFIYLPFFQVAADTLGLPQVTLTLNQILAFLPRILVALAILLVGALVGNLLAGVVRGSVGATRLGDPVLLGNLARYGVIAFGLGPRDAAGSIGTGQLIKGEPQPGMQIGVDSQGGTVEQIGTIYTSPSWPARRSWSRAAGPPTSSGAARGRRERRGKEEERRSDAAWRPNRRSGNGTIAHQSGGKMSKQMDQIKRGMKVYADGNQELGTVDEVRGDGFMLGDRLISRTAVSRVTREGVYLRDSAAENREAAGAGMQEATIDAGGELRVPVVEERLVVSKREVELGAVEVRKTVTEEQQTVPVTLQREEVTVQERDTQARPLRAGEDVFEGGTLRVPVRGEEVVVTKEAVVTGEIVIEKKRTAEQRQVSDTVRKQRVDVEGNYRQARAGFEQDFETRRTAATDDRGRTFAQAEPHYRAGFEAGHDERYQGRSFEEAEAELRQEHGSRGGDPWERLREEIRSGWNRARNG